MKIALCEFVTCELWKFDVGKISHKVVLYIELHTLLKKETVFKET